MTNEILSPVILASAIVVYIVASTYIVKLFLTQGKSTDQIILKNRLKATKVKDFLTKYPEADIKKARNFILAFGFIFAFASSISAFSYMGKKTIYTLPEELIIDSTEIIFIEPPINIKQKVVKKIVPPPPPKPIVNIKTTKEILPEIEEITALESEVEKKETFVIESDPVELVEPKEEFRVVEEMPRFRGCEGVSKVDIMECTGIKIKEYMSRVDYPEIAIDNDMEGEIYVSFTVNEKGEVVNIVLENKLGNVLDKATMKHIKKMPSFASPGKQRGKAVKVKYTVPVKFKLG